MASMRKQFAGPYSDDPGRTLNALAKRPPDGSSNPYPFLLSRPLAVLVTRQGTSPSAPRPQPGAPSELRLFCINSDGADSADTTSRAVTGDVGQRPGHGCGATRKEDTSTSS